MSNISFLASLATSTRRFAPRPALHFANRSCTNSRYYAKRFLRFFDEYTGAGRSNQDEDKEEEDEGESNSEDQEIFTQSGGEATSEDELGK
jgi:hypothetical protein